MNTEKLLKECKKYQDMCKHLKSQKILDKYYAGDVDLTLYYSLNLINDLTVKLNQVVIILNTVQELNSIVYDYVEGELNDNK